MKNKTIRREGREYVVKQGESDKINRKENRRNTRRARKTGEERGKVKGRMKNEK